jgi:hypothetical protein
MHSWGGIGMVLLIFFGTIVFPFERRATGKTLVEVRISSPVLYQGDLALLEIELRDKEKPEVIWLERPLPIFYDNSAALWYGFLSADLREKPGKKRLLVKDESSNNLRHLMVDVRAKDYGVRRLTLPKKMVDLDAPTLKRIKNESEIMRKAFESSLSTPLWYGAFIRPVTGKIVGPFGRRSIINGEPRSPHTGVDLKGPYGTPVKAMNHGEVVLTGDHYFPGRLVVIDHGGGIQSMYFHLAKHMVQSGQMVKKGEVLGLVGSTGRATGPHLHLGIRVNGCRVDPMRLTFLSARIPFQMGLGEGESSQWAGSRE